MRIEYADLSLIGDREDNQDRVAVAVSDNAAFLAVVDGMGGHADGGRAADTALKSMLDAFWRTQHPLLDPLGFVHLALARAHDDVVKLGNGLTIDARPRATTAVCLVQQGAAFWGHVGDSRVYLIRHGAIYERTRDHSHVEVLRQEGRITEDQMATHPMRNFVECCLGGDTVIPEMTTTPRRPLVPGDVLLLCTDGIWSNVQDGNLEAVATSSPDQLRSSLRALAEQAVDAAAPFADNASAAVLRWHAD
ncbi:MAG TPA: protein phosphatase 2C domain-containing protein [Steroidobacteraceae bacterium]|nr:protein phosphatase 2C domain-containing protein [Steroidobacteraceae bacterium]